MVIKLKIFRFSDFEKKEKWINNWSNKGYQLTNILFGIYLFQKNSIKYIYRIDYLSNIDMTNDQIREYIDTNKQLEIKLLLKKNNWYYFRREAVKGNYQLYSDNTSILSYLCRIRNALINFVILGNVILQLLYVFINSIYTLYISIFGGMILVLFCLVNLIPILKNIKLLTDGNNTSE